LVEEFGIYVCIPVTMQICTSLLIEILIFFKDLSGSLIVVALPVECRLTDDVYFREDVCI